MKRVILFFILSACFLACPLWAEEIVLTLDEAVALGLRNNRDVLLKAEDVLKAKEKIREARAGLWPTLDLSAAWQVTRGLYQKDVASVKTQASLQQPLYRGGAVVNTIRFHESGVSVAQALLDKTKQETAFNIQKAFLIYLLAREFAGLNEKILNNALAHLESLQVRYQNGEASHSDILNLTNSIGNIEEAREASVNQVDSALSLLRNLLFLEEDVGVRPEGEFVYEPEEVAFEEGFLKAMGNRPEIRQFEAQFKQAKHSVEIARAGNRPSITASWDYYSSSVSALSFSPTKSPNDHNIIGVTFSWPLFDGWQTKAKVEQALIDLKEAKLSNEKLMKDIALELKEAYIALKNAIAGIKTAAVDEAFYKDNLSVFEQKTQSGIVSFLDLDDARLSYQISAFNRKQAVYDYYLGKFRFDKATGGI